MLYVFIIYKFVIYIINTAAVIMNDNYPDYTPDKPVCVTGKATVSTQKGVDTYYTVDLDLLTCDCQNGKAWRWQKRRWVPNSMCSHKLRVLASLATRNSDDPVLRDYYYQQLGKTYNVFVAVSAFHKELRRGDVDAAMYWAFTLLPHRGAHGVVYYLRNILFEETRDLSLAKYIIALASKSRNISTLEMQQAVARFCAAPKKWELPWRFHIFLDEMRGYKKLAKDFGYAVAKPSNIIPEDRADDLKNKLLDGFEDGDLRLLQYGLKGWFKSQSPDHDKMKIGIFNTLTDVLNGEHDNGFDFDDEHAHNVHGVIISRIKSGGGVGYHELNALSDALSSSHEGGHKASIPMQEHKRIVSNPNPPRPVIGVRKKIPLYANDNHTWEGKRLMKAHAAQLRPSASQVDLDFRLCGAYMGVAWRYLAVLQNGTIDCNWGDVKWCSPSWLWPHLDKMWY